MWLKIIIVVLLFAAIISLGLAMKSLVSSDANQPEQRRKLVRALTFRIALSVALFILLLVSAALGWITPHGI